MLKIPISFFNETEYINYQQSLHDSEDEDLEEWEIAMKKNLGKNTVKPPKPYNTDLYLRKQDISSFHAAFQKSESKELDGTAIYTVHGDIHISTITCEEFLKIYDGV